MEKKNIDWGNLGFGYMPTDKRFVANYKNGAWDEGALIDDPMITMSECALRELKLIQPSRVKSLPSARI